MERVQFKHQLLKPRVKLVVFGSVWYNICSIKGVRKDDMFVGEPRLVHQIKKILAFVTVRGYDHLNVTCRVPVLDSPKELDELRIARPVVNNVSCNDFIDLGHVENSLPALFYVPIGKFNLSRGLRFLQRDIVSYQI